MSPSIFLSYSATKSYDPNLLKILLIQVSACVQSRGWRLNDPMTGEAAEIDGIRNKVSTLLFRSDALFAECTTGVPNVMFEIGFGRALQLPMLLFVNREAFNSDTEHVKTHLQFVGLHPDRPLPSDLGDLEYFEYTNEIRQPTGADDFRRRLNAVLDRLDKTLLAEGVRLLRRNSLSLLHETGEIGRVYKEDHPFVRFVGGWLAQLNQKLTREGRLVFQVDSDAYQSCLSAFQGWNGGAVQAIADLTDNTELFWRRKPDPLRTSVSERIFVVNWSTFFDNAGFRKMCLFLREQSRTYAVRLAHSDGNPLFDQHHFGDEGVGYHLLLMKPDVVGGYIKRSDKRYLRIESNPSLYEAASFQYELVREKSFTVNPEWTETEIRRAWMQHGKIGIWNPNWEAVQTRSEDYFIQYDMNIRFWIPVYDQLISQCSAVVQGEISRILRSESEPLNILEIGFGTGALTVPLLKWIQNLNAPFAVLRKDPPVSHYFGVDRAIRMCELVLDRIKPLAHDRSVNYSFGNGVALEGLPQIVPPRSCSVIFGSLVLHDLLGEDAVTEASEFLRSAKEVLKPGGSLVFADPFFSMEQRQQTRQLDNWRSSMMINGLTREEVDSFFKSNQDMIDGLKIEDLKRIAPSAGFEVADPGPLPGPGSLSPFRTIVLHSSE